MSRSSTTTKPDGIKAVATPDRVTTHPGEVLAEEFLKPLGLSVNALAMALRVPATRMGAIVKGERAVTADTALRLARFFGTSPEFWVNLQAMHDLTKARQESGVAIARDVQPRAA
ncbi:MAG TPA: HigA family addiction module antitoxin [Acetobacteraceae bacterium]|nr:HigA family addiction module antitoxin [Acetobacteraceae bacterium]